jgi:hypothetical protein
MKLEDVSVDKFARHETFHPRYGWVKKAVDGATQPGTQFHDENAVVLLGVGKNMVKSIKFWGLAYKVLGVAHGSKGSDLRPSAIGNAIFGPDGWDPFSELHGTHWLLHWLLLAPRTEVPAWWITFNDFPGIEFTEPQISQFILDRTKMLKVSASSIQKDVSCILRMYVEGSHARSTFDDVLDCPSRDLGLIVATPEAGVYRFAYGDRPTLPPSILAYACLDFAAKSTDASTIGLARLFSESGGPGRIFKLTESALQAKLIEACAIHPEISIQTSTGAPQLVFDDAKEAGTRVLSDYYSAETGTTVRPDEGLLCGAEATRAADVWNFDQTMVVSE